MPVPSTRTPWPQTGFPAPIFVGPLFGRPYAPPGPAVVPPVRWAGPDVVSAVQAWWQGTPAVQALASDGRLWHRVAPEDTQLPYATVFLASESVASWTTGYPAVRATVQVNCHAATDIEARAMGLAVREALGPSRAQPQGAPLVVGIREVGHVLPDGDGVDIGEELGPGGEDCWLAFETFEIPWTK